MARSTIAWTCSKFENVGAVGHRHAAGFADLLDHEFSRRRRAAVPSRAPPKSLTTTLAPRLAVCIRTWFRVGLCYVICPGFVRTPLVDKQIPEQASHLGISEEDVIKKIMLKDTVDGEFTTLQDVAAGGPLVRQLPQQRAHRPVSGSEPWLVHAIAQGRPMAKPA